MPPKTKIDYNNDGVATIIVETPSGKKTPFAVGKSFDFWDEQLIYLDLNEHEWQIADQLIGIDDDDTWCRDLDAIVDDLAFQRNVSTSVEFEEVLRTIHRFDPPGYAVNLQECLQIQLERKEQNSMVKLAPFKIINFNLTLLPKHYDKIMKVLDIEEQQLKRLQRLSCI